MYIKYRRNFDFVERKYNFRGNPNMIHAFLHFIIKHENFYFNCFWGSVVITLYTYAQLKNDTNFNFLSAPICALNCITSILDFKLAASLKIWIFLNNKIFYFIWKNITLFKLSQATKSLTTLFLFIRAYINNYECDIYIWYPVGYRKPLSAVKYVSEFRFNAGGGCSLCKVKPIYWKTGPALNWTPRQTSKHYLKNPTRTDILYTFIFNIMGINFTETLLIPGSRQRVFII
jgi:hypothetical protein